MTDISNKRVLWFATKSKRNFVFLQRKAIGAFHVLLSSPVSLEGQMRELEGDA